MAHRFTNAYGQEHLQKVESEIWHDQSGRLEYAIVWLIGKSGNLYSRSINHGETIDGVVAYYSRTMLTDGKSVFMGVLKAVHVADC